MQASRAVQAAASVLPLAPPLVLPPACPPACRWDSSGYFKPDDSAPGEPYVISMPPPNVTGKLHMGHAMFATLQARTLTSIHAMRALTGRHGRSRNL